jgi:DNA-binding IclR family transcriptional regulator
MFPYARLFARSERPLRVSEIARNLNYNGSTVYSLVHTLWDLEVLEQVPENRFRFGARLDALGKSPGRS